VACRVTGTLKVNTDAFSVGSQLVQEESLLSTQDAQWLWLVTPKKPGDYSAVIQLEPIVSFEDQNDVRTFEERLPSKNFTSRVTVAPLDRSAKEMVEDWTKMLVALGALIGALVALLAGLSRLLTGSWLPRRRLRATGSDQEGNAGREEDQVGGAGHEE